MGKCILSIKSLLKRLVLVSQQRTQMQDFEAGIKV